MLKKYSGIIGILILFAGGVFYSIFPEWNKIYGPAFLLGGLAVLCAAFLHRQFLYSLLRGRAVKYSTNSILYILIVFAILALLNFVSFRNHKRIDLSSSQLNSLSPQTLGVLKGLHEPVHIFAFYKEENRLKDKVEKLLALYRYHSPYIRYEVIDPVAKPGILKEKKINQEELGRKIDGMALLEQGERQVRTFDAKEEELTNAIIELSRGTRKVACFLQGHGEKDPDTKGEKGISRFAALLRGEYYDVRGLYLSQEGGIPDDCTVLVLAGPREKLFDFELAALKSYLMKGGRVLILLDPGSDAGLADLLSGFGLIFENNYIVDPRFNFNDQLTPRALSYSDHEVTRGWNRKFNTVYPVASSVKWFDVRDPRLYNEDLVKTSRYSWAEADISKGEFDPDGDPPGPFTVVSIAYKKLEADEVKEIKLRGGETREFRLALAGDSDFITDGFIDINANENLILNLMGWLAQEENLVSIRRKTITGQAFFFSPQKIKALLYSILGIPVLVIIAGIIIWLRRRTL